MPKIMALVLSLVLASCSGSNDLAAVVAQALPPVSFGDAPMYARVCASASDADIVAVSSYEDMNVNVRVPGSDPLVETTINFSSCPQGVVVGTDDAGAKFLIVSTVNYETNESSLVWFVDTDADDLPDSASKALIESVSDAHIVSLSYDQDDVVMYALDGKNDLIYRYTDTSGDNVPDASSRSTMIEAGGVLGPKVRAREILAATANSVVVIPTMDSKPGRFYPLIRTFTGVYLDLKHVLSDTNADGVADAAVSDPLFGFQESVESVLEHGDDTVRIKGADETAYSVVAETPAGVQEVLATFVGNGLAQELSLSRDLDGEDELLLIRDSDNAVLSREQVSDEGATHVYAITGVGATLEGGIMKFSGTNLTGTESVTMRVQGADSWTTGTVTGFTSEELTVAVPDLELDPGDISQFAVQISDGTTTLFCRWGVYVRGQ